MLDCLTTAATQAGKGGFELTRLYLNMFLDSPNQCPHDVNFLNTWGFVMSKPTLFLWWLRSAIFSCATALLCFVPTFVLLAHEIYFKFQVLNEEEKNRNGGFAELKVWGDNLLVLELGCPSLKIKKSWSRQSGDNGFWILNNGGTWTGNTPAVFSLLLAAHSVCSIFRSGSFTFTFFSHQPLSVKSEGIGISHVVWTYWRSCSWHYTFLKKIIVFSVCFLPLFFWSQQNSWACWTLRRELLRRKSRLRI